MNGSIGLNSGAPILGLFLPIMWHDERKGLVLFFMIFKVYPYITGFIRNLVGKAVCTQCFLDEGALRLDNPVQIRQCRVCEAILR